MGPAIDCFFNPDFPRDNCTEGDIRISEVFVSDDLNSGLVEVCQSGIWQKVCYNELFNANAANVVCRHLGLESYEGMPYTHNVHVHVATTIIAFFKTGLVPVIDSALYPRSPPLPTYTLRGPCNGNEQRLQNCQFVPQKRRVQRGASSECSDKTYARVFCQGWI